MLIFLLNCFGQESVEIFQIRNALFKLRTLREKHTGAILTEAIMLENVWTSPTPKRHTWTP